jgi:hypothetical protein
MFKRGSLQLSINAIVVLILAITMLGLGLAFMRSSFFEVISQFEDVSAEVQKDMLDRLQQSPENIVLDRYEIEVNQGDKKEIYLALRNDLGMQADFHIDKEKESSKTCGENEPTTHCCIAVGDSNCTDITLKTFSRITLIDGESKVLKVIFQVGPRADKDTYKVPIRVVASGANVPFDKTETIDVIVK